MKTIFILHIFCTFFMTGLIWLVQIVHYPLFDQVGQPNFVQYEHLHTQKIALIVFPIMFLELITAVMLVSSPDPMALFADYQRHFWIAGFMLAAVWLCTVFFQVPQHHALSQGFDPKTYAALVKTNWIRTLAWTGRSGVLLWVLHDVLR